jgi:hypothetical protein
MLKIRKMAIYGNRNKYGVKGWRPGSLKALMKFDGVFFDAFMFYNMREP